MTAVCANLRARISLRRGPHVLLLALSAAIFFPLTAAANTITVTRSIEVPGEDGNGLVANVQAVFDFDETCDPGSQNCSLDITLSYLGYSGADLTAPGQALTGLTFSPSGSATFSDGLGSGGSAALSGDASFVGDGASTASDALGNNVSSHWGLNENLAFTRDRDLGSILLASVGDVTFGGETATGIGQIAAGHLFDSNPSTVEPVPPNGISFALVAPGTCVGASCPGSLLAGGPHVYIQSQLTATIPYAGGTLESIDTSQVNFLFGTDGNIVPEPSTGLLLGAGLLGLLGMRRRGGIHRS